MKRFDLTDGEVAKVSANRIIEIIANGIRQLNSYGRYGLRDPIPDEVIEERARTITTTLILEGQVKL